MEIFEVLKSELFMSVLVAVVALVLGWMKVKNGDKKAETIGQAFAFAVRAAEKLKKTDLNGKSQTQVKLEALAQARTFMGEKNWKDVAASANTRLQTALYEMELEDPRKVAPAKKE